jgi:hypothetical protein
MSWHWFYALYSMASVFIIIGFIWKLAIIPLALITMPFNSFFQKVLFFFILLIPNYFMASYSVLVCLYVNDGEKSVFTLIIGALFLGLYLFFGVAQAQNEAEREFDYSNMHLIRYRYWGILLTIIYFVYSIFDLRLATNSSISKIANLIGWVQGVPIINWIIAAGGFLYVLYIMLMSIFALVGMISIALEKRNTNDVIDI